MNNAASVDLVFQSASVTHVGNVREVNEDSVFVDDKNHLWAVADGMGGYQGGDIASKMIVKSLSSVGIPSSAPDFKARVLQRLNDANSAIHGFAVENDRGTIGSTVVALLIYETSFSCVWCGDSRLYRIRNGEMQQVSVDHSEVQELLSSGAITAEEAENWPRKNVITRAVGVGSEVMLDSVFGEVERGDLFVLCSDGLNAHVSDQEVVDAVHGIRPQTACDRLLEMVLDRGGSDNTSIIVVAAQMVGTTVPVGTMAAAHGTG